MKLIGLAISIIISLWIFGTKLANPKIYVFMYMWEKGRGVIIYKWVLSVLVVFGIFTMHEFMIPLSKIISFWRQ